MSALAPQRLIGPLGLAACPPSNWIRTGQSVRSTYLVHTTLSCIANLRLPAMQYLPPTYLPNNGFKSNLEEQMFLPWRLWVEIEAHKWRDLELNLSKTVEELRQDSQLIQANSKKKLRDNKKLLECSFAQIQFQITSLDFRWRLGPWLIVCISKMK